MCPKRRKALPADKTAKKENRERQKIRDQSTILGK
jgi:hypothetical protein